MVSDHTLVPPQNGREESTQTPLPVSQISNDCMNQMQTELEDFVSRTRRRLHSISKSIADSSSNLPTNHQPTTSVASETKTAIEPLKTTDHAVPTIDLPSIDSPSNQEPVAQSTAVPKPEPAVDENDPLHRLNAIKIRLAKQIESSL